MNASSWKRHIDVLQKYDVIILQVGGNDVSQHPRRKTAPVESIGDTKKVLKELLDWVKENEKVGYIMPIINRDCSWVAIEMLNSRIEKTFKQYALKELPITNLSSDRVHLTPDGYSQPSDYLINFAKSLK